GGLVGAKAAALAEGLLTSTFSSRLVMALAVVGLILAGLGVGSAARESPASVPPAARAAAPEPAADQGDRPQRLASWPPHAELAAHAKAARAVAFSPDGRRIATGGDDGCVRVWDVAGSKELMTLPLPDAHPVRAVAFSRTGDALAAGTEDGAVFT